MDFFRRLWRCVFVWDLPAASEQKISASQVIVTQACSRLKNGAPGPGNEIMAATTRNLHAKTGLPILAQEEVAMADPGLPYAAIAGGSPDGRSTFSWNTYEVAKIQEKICRKNRWKKVIVVAMPVHVGRALWTYQRLGLDASPASMPKGDYYPHKLLIPWSHRGKVRLAMRELLCRILFLLQGRI